MVRKVIFVALFAALFSTALSAQSTQPATADDARALLNKAVAAIQADKAKALDMFNKGEGGFAEGDLYVFCVNASDGSETAHPIYKGHKITDFKDANGFAFGEEIMRRATEGKIDEIAYLWPRPGSKTPSQKITFFTKVSDQICGVGYYK